MKKYNFLFTLLMFLSSQVFAASIHETQVRKTIKEYYPELKKAIEDNNMHVIYELDLLERFKEAGYAEKFGNNFNKNNIVAIKTLLICNGYIGNQVSNIDTDMMVLCPIKITLIQIGKYTMVSFIKNSDLASNKEVEKLLAILDQTLVNTIALSHDSYMDNAESLEIDSQFEGS